MFAVAVMVAALATAALADDVADLQAAENQFDRLYIAGRYREAEPYAKAMLTIAERAFWNQPNVVAICLEKLGQTYERQTRYAEAEPLFRRSLRMREQALGRDHQDVMAGCLSLANLMQEQHRYPEAESLYERILETSKRTRANTPELLAQVFNNLGVMYDDQARFTEAEQFYRRSLEIRETVLGPEHPSVSESLNNLAAMYDTLGQDEESLRLHKRALQLAEKVLGPEQHQASLCRTNLARGLTKAGRYAEAERLLLRSLEINERILGPAHADVAGDLRSLANLYAIEGRAAEAEPLYKRSLRIYEQALGPRHPYVVDTLNNLVHFLQGQGRYAEAEPLSRRALQVAESNYGADHLNVAESLDMLAGLLDRQGRHADADSLIERYLRIREKSLGPEHPEFAKALVFLGAARLREGRHAEAEALFKRALAIHEKSFGTDHATVAADLLSLAFLYYEQKRDADAESFVNRAIPVVEDAQLAPGARFTGYVLRALIEWRQKKTSQALQDLAKGLDLAELSRTQSAGGEQERAQFFGPLTDAFEQMAAWQIELGDAAQALAAADRARARALLDEMKVSGADLQMGRPAGERQQVRQRLHQRQLRVAELERQMTAATGDELSRLETELARARQGLYEQYRDDRASSPVYRELLSVEGHRPELAQLQSSLLGGDALLLVYLLGAEGGYVIALDAREARGMALNIDATAARQLQIDQGPLTAERMSAICSNDSHTGVVDLLVQPDRSTQAAGRLAALWNVLVPARERAAILSGNIKRLIVVPDGPLALVPFETLVVEQGAGPRYLVDAGPPILYAPSATVLYNLAQRPRTVGSNEGSTGRNATTQPVLTVAHPIYRRPTGKQPASTAEDLAAPGRYRSAGGTLGDLPFTATESAWVADAFKKQQIAVGALREGLATEHNVRGNAAGRRVLHLACHGLADQAYGNFFGCLALTPGTTAATNPADDGFLTLPEIYGLNLKGCELAILSACQTNYGPQQKGEGVWALSRGFLVAGARRVVASNWLVDDEAAASLVSAFCTDLAKAEGRGATPDYAAALHRAKRWVRKQDKWASPYYWGTFVLVGPN